MVVLNYTGGEVNAKIVYYGPGLSGKTTNLEFIHDRTPEDSRGKMVSMKTQTDRTLFFDFLPLELGEISGYRTRFLLYTVPGQVYYNATRKLVLKGVDAVVFVADSSRSKLDENLESLRNLEQNLNEHGMSLDETPWVIQYNKRDATDAMAVADLDARLNPLRVPSYEAVATHGDGVYETFHGIATLVYRVLKERLERELETAPAAPAGAAQGRPAPAVVSASVRSETPRRAAAAEGEVEFDSAIDSMLREMDAPAAPRKGTAAPPQPVQRTVNIPEPAAPGPAASPAAPVARAEQGGAAPRTKPAAGKGVFDRAPEAFDLELGRLPALEDAAFASESARDEGPHEFVTDPMRRAPGKDAPVAPRKDAASPAARAQTAPVAEPAGPVSVPAPEIIHVPVELSAAQLQPGASIRVVLEIHVKDE